MQRKEDGLTADLAVFDVFLISRTRIYLRGEMFTAVGALNAKFLYQISHLQVEIAPSSHSGNAGPDHWVPADPLLKIIVLIPPAR